MKPGAIAISLTMKPFKSLYMLFSAIFLCATFLYSSVLLAQQPLVDEWHYTLRPGDNLQKVSKGLLGRQHTWADLIQYNKIENVSALAPGSIIKVPMHWLKHQPKPALAKAVSGSVMIKRASKSIFKVLKENMSIRVGDEVATRDGDVLVEFADGSTIRLEENSNLVFNKLSHFGKTGMVDTRLRLKKGSLSTEVTPLVKGSRYEITTPSAVAAVRGTEFRLSTGNGETQIEVVKGVVAFSGEHGTTEVTEGNGARIKQGSSIVQRTKLPEAPKALFSDAVVDSLPSKLKWKKLKDAESYQVQLTDSKQNGRLVKKENLRDPELELNHIENGEYDISMRAISNEGFEGVDSKNRIAVDIGTEKATLIAPLDKSTLDKESLNFNWRFVKPSTLGKVQISKDSGFNLIVGETEYDSIDSVKYRKGLPPGSYYWRVVSLAEDSETANSEARSFAIRGILKPIEILSVNYVDNQVGLFWNKIDNTQAYILQVSESKSFDSILKEETLTKARAHLRLSPGKRYFARVKGIGNELFSSKFGPIKELYIEEK
jgi:hypothetical protein